VECLIVAALLCLSEPASVTSFQNGFAAGAWVNANDVLITSVIASDDVGYPDKSLMRAHCVDSVCVYTKVRCHIGDKINCTVDYVTSQVDVRRHVSVVGKSKDEIVAALSPIALEPIIGLSVKMSDLGFEEAIEAAMSKPPLFQ
jgi:hypothetical protein